MSDHDKIYSTKFQDKIERNTLLMFVMTAFAVAIGGIVEIVPLFYLPNTGMASADGTYNNTQHKDRDGNVIPMDKIVWNPATSEHKTLDEWQPGDGVRPYKPLELAGQADGWYAVGGGYRDIASAEIPELTLPGATVRVIAQQWAWTFVHPGPDGKLDTPDDIAKVNEMHVQVDRLHHFQLESKDVIHSFSVPVFRLKQDVIPGRVITGWFTPTKTGTYDIQCTEICGVGHALMPAKIVIETPAQHAEWIAKNSSVAVASAALR